MINTHMGYISVSIIQDKTINTFQTWYKQDILLSTDYTKLYYESAEIKDDIQYTKWVNTLEESYCPDSLKPIINDKEKLINSVKECVENGENKKYLTNDCWIFINGVQKRSDL